MPLPLVEEVATGTAGGIVGADCPGGGAAKVGAASTAWPQEEQNRVLGSSFAPQAEQNAATGHLLGSGLNRKTTDYRAGTATRVAMVPLFGPEVKPGLLGRGGPR